MATHWFNKEKQLAMLVEPNLEPMHYWVLATILGCPQKTKEKPPGGLI